MVRDDAAISGLAFSNNILSIARKARAQPVAQESLQPERGSLRSLNEIPPATRGAAGGVTTHRPGEADGRL